MGYLGYRLNTALAVDYLILKGRDTKYISKVSQYRSRSRLLDLQGFNLANWQNLSQYRSRSRLLDLIVVIMEKLSIFKSQYRSRSRLLDQLCLQK